MNTNKVNFNLVVTASAMVLVLANCGSDAGTPGLNGADAGGGTDLASRIDPVRTSDAGVDTRVTTDASTGRCLTPVTITADAKLCVTHTWQLAHTPYAVALTSDKLLTYAGKNISQQSLEVLSWPIDSAEKLGPAALYFSADPATTDKIYPSGFLAVAPNGNAAIGYTEEKTFDGTIYWGGKGSAPQSIGAKGNYDAAYWDDQHLLVNGLGMPGLEDGTALFVAENGKPAFQLISGLGDASGYVSVGSNFLLVGGFDNKTFANRIYAFTRAEINAAIASKTTLSAETDGDIVFEGSAFDIVAWDDALVYLEANVDFQVVAIKHAALTIAADKITAAPATVLATPAPDIALSQLTAYDKNLAIVLTDAAASGQILVLHKTN